MKSISKFIFFIYFTAISISLIAQKSEKVKVSNLKLVNTTSLDFSPAFYKKDLVFVSNNPIKGKDKIFDKSIKQPSMSLFITKKDKNGYFKRPQPFDSAFISKVHEGPVTFDIQNDAIYFTRNDNVNEGKKANFNNGISYMKIFISYRTSEGWSEPESFPYNDDFSDACHPTISPDGERLFFVSNRKGGFGGMDLYMCKKVDDDWDTPINLGENVNSEKNEAFPFIHDDGTLYFASDVEEGMGGMDIYYTRADSKGEFIKPEALKPPFNSSQDDFGFIVDTDSKIAYFSSNRKGTVGGDDIWVASIPEGVAPFSDVLARAEKLKNAKADKNNKLMTIYAIDRKTGLPISKAYICTATTGAKKPSVENAGVDCETTITDENGKAFLQLNVEDNYYIRINKTEFKPSQLGITKDEVKNEIVILMDKGGDLVSYRTDDALQNASVPVKTTYSTTLTSNTNGDARVHYLHNIYYDYDDASIRYDARIGLDTLVAVLTLYPDMEIELAAHTDSRGNVPYNMELSKKRANNAKEYIVSRGISRDRIKTVAYGKEQLANKCRDGVPCPPEKHQENRRTEVRILKSGGADGKIIQQR